MAPKLSYFLELLQPRAYRHIFQKACQDGLSTFERSGEEHAIGFQSAHLSRSKISDDHDLASDQSLRRVGFGDSGKDLAGFGAEIHFKTQQLVSALHFFCDLDLRDAELYFRKIVDRDLAVGSSRRCSRLIECCRSL